MATTLNITSTYAGEHAGKYISASLLSANTILKGGVEVRPNIKFKEVVSKLATDDLLKDGTCDFTATSTVTKTERILQPKELQVNLQLYILLKLRKYGFRGHIFLENYKV